MKKLKICVAIVVTIVMMTSCSSAPSLLGGGEIAIVLPGADHGWTGAVLVNAKEVSDSINEEGKYQTRIYASASAQTQEQQISELLTGENKPEGIVILPYDNTVADSVADIAESGIPFLMFDRIIEDEAVQQAVVSNVKGDNYEIGALTAKRFIEEGLQPGDNVLVMIGDKSSVPEVRNEGFIQTLTEAGWTQEQLESLKFTEDTGWSRETSSQMFIQWANETDAAELAEYKYIFTHDDEIAMGALEALSGDEIDEEKKQIILDSVVSIASSSGLEEMYSVLRGEHENSEILEIVQGIDLFSVTYSPDMIEQAIKCMLSHLDSNEVEFNNTIPVEVVDKENAANYEGF